MGAGSATAVCVVWCLGRGRPRLFCLSRRICRSLRPSSALFLAFSASASLSLLMISSSSSSFDTAATRTRTRGYAQPLSRRDVAVVDHEPYVVVDARVARARHARRPQGKAHASQLASHAVVRAHCRPQRVAARTSLEVLPNVAGCLPLLLHLFHVLLSLRDLLLQPLRGLCGHFPP